MHAKLSRREMLRLLGVTGGVTLLAACAPTPAGTTAEAPSTGATDTPEAAKALEATATSAPAAGKNVTISFVEANPEYTKFWEGLIADFQTGFPNIKVQHDVAKTDNMGQIISSRMAAGELDVYRSQSMPTTIEEAESMYLDLSGEKWLSYLDPNALKIVWFQFSGKQWSVPVGVVGTSVVYYNKTYTDTLNLTEPKTWAEFVAFLDSIQKDGQMAPILYGGADKWPLNMVFIGIEAGVLRPVKPNFWEDVRTEKEKLDDPLIVECFTKMKKLGEYFQKNALGEAYDNIPGMFTQKKGAVLIDGAWRAGPFDTDLKPDFTIGVFLPPTSDTAENNKFFTVQPAYGLSIYPSGDADRIAASKQFMEYIFQPTNYQKLVDATGFTPVEPNITVKGDVAQNIAKLMSSKIVVTQWENLHIPGAKYNSTDLNNELLNGNITPEQAATEFHKAFIESKPDWK